MTRQRDNRSDWSTMSAKQRREQRAGLAALNRRDCTVCDGGTKINPRGTNQWIECPHCNGTSLEPMPADQQSIIDQAGPALAPKTRARPVQHEDAAMDHLAVLVDGAWWEPGFQRFEHRGDGGKWSDIKGGRKRKQQGAKPGFPDCGLIVPMTEDPARHEAMRVWDESENGKLAAIKHVRVTQDLTLKEAKELVEFWRIDSRPSRAAVRAYCEVKAEHHRPKRELPELWWVGIKTELRPVVRDKVHELERFIVGSDAQSKAHVDAWQIYWLDLLHRSGHATHVAYGAEDAFQWLDAQAGPRPEVLPW